MKRPGSLAALLLLLVAVSLPSVNHARSQETAAIGPAVVAVPTGETGIASSGPTGHFDSQVIARVPTAPYDTVARSVTDKVFFHTDEAAGIFLRLKDAEVGDRWTFKYFFPGNPTSGPPDQSCPLDLLPADHPSNPSIYVALVGYVQCVFPQVLIAFPAGCPCATVNSYGMIANVAGYPAASAFGTWAAVVDFRDGAGAVTPAVAQDTMILKRAPLVAVTHGWESDCGASSTLMQLLRDELAIAANRVACYDYDSRKGVKDAACGKDGDGNKRFGQMLLDLQSKDPLSEVDIVAHSMGGLVTRYYYQFCRQPGDPSVGSISMLGTPNGGAQIAELEPWVCGSYVSWLPGAPIRCAVGNWAFERLTDIDLHSQAVKDLKPDSDVLKKKLNAGFVLPQSPIYRAHAGRKDTPIGWLTSGEGENDCFISADSVAGPGSVFNSILAMFQYPGVSHTDFGIPGIGCSTPTLTDSLLVVQNALPDIKGTSVLGSAGAAANVQIAAATSDLALNSAIFGVVQPSQQVTQVFNVLGTPIAPPTQASFTVVWATDDTPPDIGFTLRRPDGQLVATSDADVLESIAATGNGMYYMQVKGLVLSSPVAGPWEVTLTGSSIPANGWAYIAMLDTASEVEAVAEVASSAIAQGQPAIITAELIDGGAPIAASAAGAQVLDLDGSPQSLPLYDDGPGGGHGDEVAGDKKYSATYAATSGCGTYRVLATLSGSSSEGAVTRQDLLTFEAYVPGDAIRDACSADDDEDGLSDESEFETYGTDPLEPDTDTDGCRDGSEAAQNPIFGGDRDPLTKWDFYDVTGDAAIDLSDALAILNRFGALPGQPEYDALFDRYAPDTTKTWRTAAAIGNQIGIDLQDALVNLQSFGHNCATAGSTPAEGGGVAPADVQPGTYSMEVTITPAEALINANFVFDVGITNEFGSPQCTDGLTNGIDDDADLVVDNAEEAGLGALISPLPEGCYRTVQWNVDYDETLITIGTIVQVSASGAANMICATNNNGTRLLVGCVDTGNPRLTYSGSYFRVAAVCKAAGNAAFSLSTGSQPTRVSSDEDNTPLPMHLHDDSIRCDDGDGIADAADNCPNHANPLQENTDKAPYDAPPAGPSASDDVTVPGADALGDACDADDDNDWLPDSAEAAGCNGSGALAVLLNDTDGDHVLDGAECQLGSNPGNAASKPGVQTGDTDGDGLGPAAEAFFGSIEGDSDSDDDTQPDGLEVKGYGSRPGVKDSDADGICDAQEMASVNGDSVVDNRDLQLIEKNDPPKPYHFVYDVTRDAFINNGDTLLVSSQLPTSASRCMLP